MLQTYHKPNYEATNLDYRRFNESRKIENPADKIILPTYGSFFADSLTVYNARTGVSLVRGRDYVCQELDYVASKKSGKEVYQQLKITINTNEVNYNYMFVGGDHLNGRHLIEEAKKIFPAGVQATFPWDNVMNRPDTFKPKSHAMNIQSTYGYDGANYSMNRVTEAIKRGIVANTSVIFDMVKDKTTIIENKTNDTIQEIEDYLNETFEALRVQVGEYIFTDNAEDPAIKRKYGSWTRITNTILRGVNDSSPIIVGTDGRVSINRDIGYGQQALRNCYIWQNGASAGNNASFTLTQTPHIGMSVNTYREEEDIEFKIKALRVDLNQPFRYVIYNLDTGAPVDNKYIYGSSHGELMLNMVGEGSFKIKVKARTDIDNANLRLQVQLMSGHTWATSTIVDSSSARFIKPVISGNITGTQPLTTLIEGQEFYLVLKTVGYNVGETIYVDDSLSGIRNSDLEFPYPLVMTVPDSKTIPVLLKVKEDRLSEGPETLLLYFKNSVTEAVTTNTPVVQAKVLDTSVFNQAFITFFNKETSQPTAVSDEGATIRCEVRTTLPNVSLTLQYDSSKPLASFSGLVENITTGNILNDGMYVATFEFQIRDDNRTNPGVNYINVSALESIYGVIGSNTLNILDTSQTPNYITRVINGDSVTTATVNEGETFFVEVSVPNWIEANGEPKLGLKYGMGDSFDSTDIELRVQGGLYTAMEFGPSAGTRNNVQWVAPNRLLFRFTAVDDKLVKGDVDFKIWVTGEGEDFKALPSASVRIRDISLPDVLVRYSSSSIEFIPILSTNEMNSDGTNAQCFMWVEVAGDVSALGNITVSVDKAAELDNWLTPKTINFNNTRRQIVPVVIKADFINDGDMELNFHATYVMSGETRDFFRSPLQVIDNSILHPITIVMTQTVNPVNETDTFTESDVFYSRLTFPGYAFETTLKLTIMQLVNGVWVPNTTDFDPIVLPNLPANVNNVLLSLSPIKDKALEGTETFKLVVTRHRLSGGQQISQVSESKVFMLLDTSLPTDLLVEIYTDASRTTIRTNMTFDEGEIIYARYIVQQPQDLPSGERLVFGIARSNTSLQSNKSWNNVIEIIPPSTGNKIIDVNFWRDKDRLTTGDINLSATGQLYYRMAPSVGAGLSGTSAYTAGKNFTIRDSSLTPSYNLVLPATPPKEDDVAFSVALEIVDGTVGDVYYVSVSNAFDTSRFSLSQFGIEQLLVLNNDVLRWNFKLKPDYKTNPLNTIGIKIYNKSSGKEVASGNITVIDSSQTPVLTLLGLKNFNGNLMPATIGEYGSGEFYLAAYGENMPPNEKIKLSVDDGGRIYSDVFLGGGMGFNTWYNVGNIDIGSGVMKTGVMFPITIKNDKKTNTVAELKLPIRMDCQVSKSVLGANIQLDDTSKERVLQNYRWEVGGAVANWVNEGQTVTLIVNTNGGLDKYPVKLTYSGGRPLDTGYTSHEVGVIKTQGEARFNFTPKPDSKTNPDSELSIKVEVVMDDGVVNGGSVYDIPAFPIIDTSKNTRATIKFKDTSLNPITQVMEGQEIFVQFDVLDMVPNAVYKGMILTYVNTDGTLIYTYTPITLANPTPGAVHGFTSPKIRVPADSLNNPAQKFLHAWFATEAGSIISTGNIPVIDASRDPIVQGVDFRIGSTSSARPTISELDEGSSFTVNIATKCFDYVDLDQYPFNITFQQDTVGNYVPLLPEIHGTFRVTRAMVDAAVEGEVILVFKTYKDLDTWSPERRLYAKLTGHDTYLGRSNAVTIKDVSTVPYLDAVMYALDGTALTRIDPDVTKEFDIVVTGKFLTADKSSILADLTHPYSGYLGFNELRVLPSYVNMINDPLVDPDGWGYRGVARAKIINPMEALKLSTLDNQIVTKTSGVLILEVEGISNFVTFYVQIFNRGGLTQLKFEDGGMADTAIAKATINVGSGSVAWSIKVHNNGLAEIGGTMKTSVGLFVGKPVNTHLNRLEDAIITYDVEHIILDD